MKKDWFISFKLILNYFTSTNTRRRFGDVLRTLEAMPECGFIVNDIPLNKDFGGSETSLQKKVKN